MNPYIGCVLGRYANRIKDGLFSIKGKEYQLYKNDMNKHHLHGGLSLNNLHFCFFHNLISSSIM